MIDEMRATPEKRHDGWYARVTVNGKKKRKHIGPLDDATEQATKDFCEAWERRARRRALWEDGATQPLPCSEALPAWLATYGPTMAKRTANNARARVAMLVEYLGAKDFRELTESDARALVNAKIETHAGTTIAGALSILRRALNVAVADRLIPENPIPTLHRVIADAENMGRTEIEVRDAWTRDEAELILALAEKKSKPLAHALLVLFQTGMRRGEVLALEWRDVDFARNRIWVRRASEVGGKETKIPKTKRQRWVPMSQRLRAAIEAEQTRQARMRLKMYPECNHVCPSPKLLFWAERNFSRSFEKLRGDKGKHFKKAKIRPLPLHCTRHSFITWALEAGTPTASISAWLSVTVRVLEQTYAHVIPQASGVDFLDRPQASTNRPQDLTNETEASA